MYTVCWTCARRAEWWQMMRSKKWLRILEFIENYIYSVRHNCTASYQLNGALIFYQSIVCLWKGSTPPYSMNKHTLWRLAWMSVEKDNSTSAGLTTREWIVDKIHVVWHWWIIASGSMKEYHTYVSGGKVNHVVSDFGFMMTSWTTFVGFGGDRMVQGCPAPYNICAASREAPQWRMCWRPENGGRSDCRWCFVCGSRGEENMSWLEGDGAPSVVRGGSSMLLTDPSSVSMTIKVIGLVKASMCLYFTKLQI